MPSENDEALSLKLAEQEHHRQKYNARFPKPKKNSPEYKRGKLKGYKNGKSKKENKLEKISRIIQTVKPLKDDTGEYFAYCSFGHHQGIIGETKLLNNGDKCLKCDYLVIFRPSKQRPNNY